MSEKRKLPIDRPCSACSAGDTKMEYHDHRPPFREPVASPQDTRLTCPSCGYTKEDADFHLDHHLCNLTGKAPWECAAQPEPSEGTTPQAERLELLALRKKFKDEHMLNEQDSARSEELIEIICAPRAVAPVETRLTAEQFWPMWVNSLKVCKTTMTPRVPRRECLCKTYPDNLGSCLEFESGKNGRCVYCDHTKECHRRCYLLFAEAFRDKSEAQSQQFAAQLESNIQFLNERVAEQKRYIDQCHTAHAGLREEIERLKEGERLLRDFLERDYGVSEITTICSRYDDAEQELTELRAKLAEQERENAELLEDIQAEYEATDKAEDEAAALRERERECICVGNWRIIVKETEKLIDRYFTDERGDNYRFVGIVHGGMDYYYGMYSKKHGLRLLSCVGDITGHNFKLVGKALSAAPERGKDGK